MSSRLLSYKSAAIDNIAKDASLPTATRGSFRHRHQSSIMDIHMVSGCSRDLRHQRDLQREHKPHISAWRHKYYKNLSRRLTPENEPSFILDVRGSEAVARGGGGGTSVQVPGSPMISRSSTAVQATPSSNSAPPWVQRRPSPRSEVRQAQR